MSHRRSHPSAGVVEDVDLGASTGLGNEFDISVVNPSTLVTTKLFRFIDSGVAVFAGGLTVSAFAAGVVHSSSAGVFSSSPVLLSELGQSGATTSQVAAWNGSAWAAASVSAVLPSLAGDVTGAPGANTVVQLSGSGGVVAVGAQNLQWAKGVSSPVLGQAAQTTDVATTDLRVRSQAPFASSTGTNRNPGNLFFEVPPAASGGSAGRVGFVMEGLESITMRYGGGPLVGLTAGSLPTFSHLAAYGTPAKNGVLAATAYTDDNVFLSFDAEWTSSAHVARNATVGVIQKLGGQLFLGGSAGNTVGAATSITKYWVLDLATGKGVHRNALRVGDATFTLPTNALEVVGSASISSLGAGVVHASSAGLLSSGPVLPTELGAGGATSGQILSYGGSAWGPVTLTLSGLGGVPTTRTLTGTAPITVDGDNAAHDLSANRTIAIATATTGALGAIQLAGDLAGTGTAPTVVGLTGASGVVAVHGASLVWDVGSALSGAVGAVIKQADRNFAGSTAASTHVSAQNNTGSASTGGSYIIDAGTGIGNASGVVMLRSDSTLAGGGIGVFAIGSNALTMLNTSSLSLSDGFANLVATLTPVYNGQTELTFASTVERFDIDFVDGSVPDGSAADIHITAQNNGDLSTGIGGSVFVGSGTGALSGSVELLAGGTTRIKADKNGIGFFGTTPVARSAAYAIAHHTPLRTIDEGAPTLTTVAQLLGTVVSDLVALGLLQ